MEKIIISAADVSITAELLDTPTAQQIMQSLPIEAIQSAHRYSQQADLFFVVGTSAVVQPAASLPMIAKESGAYVVEVNMDPTPISSYVHEAFHGKAGEILPELWQQFLDNS